MSYILDALTKSQRERREATVPTLSTTHLGADTPPPRTGARGTALAFGLAAVSIACMLVITAVAVEIPADFANPLLDFALPRFLAGEVAVNPQLLDVRLPPATYGTGQAATNSASFNLGELAGLHGLIGLAPLVALWAAAGFALALGGRKRV